MKTNAGPAARRRDFPGLYFLAVHGGAIHDERSGDRAHLSHSARESTRQPSSLIASFKGLPVFDDESVLPNDFLSRRRTPASPNSTGTQRCQHGGVAQGPQAELRADAGGVAHRKAEYGSRLHVFPLSRCNRDIWPRSEMSSVSEMRTQRRQHMGRAQSAAAHRGLEHGERFVQRAALLVKRGHGVHPRKMIVGRRPSRSRRADAHRFWQTSGIKFPTLGTMPSAPSFKPFSMSAPDADEDGEIRPAAETPEQFLVPRRIVLRILDAHQLRMSQQGLDHVQRNGDVRRHRHVVNDQRPVQTDPAATGTTAAVDPPDVKPAAAKRSTSAPARRNSLPEVMPSGCVSPMPGINQRAAARPADREFHQLLPRGARHRSAFAGGAQHKNPVHAAGHQRIHQPLQPPARPARRRPSPASPSAPPPR